MSVCVHICTPKSLSWVGFPRNRDCNRGLNACALLKECSSGETCQEGGRRLGRESEARMASRVVSPCLLPWGNSRKHTWLHRVVASTEASGWPVVFHIRQSWLQAAQEQGPGHLPSEAAPFSQGQFSKEGSSGET